MQSPYNTNHTREEIDSVLSDFKNMVLENRYVVSMNDNRQENISFTDKYNLRGNRLKSVLLSIETEDFCYSVNNIKPGYEHEILYIFVPQVVVHDSDDIAHIIDTYIKFTFLSAGNYDYTAVISFHQRNKPIRYLFR